MPENALPLTKKRSAVSFELPKSIEQEETSADDNVSEGVEKDSDEGL